MLNHAPVVLLSIIALSSCGGDVKTVNQLEPPAPPPTAQAPVRESAGRTRFPQTLLEQMVADGVAIPPPKSEMAKALRAGDLQRAKQLLEAYPPGLEREQAIDIMIREAIMLDTDPNSIAAMFLLLHESPYPNDKKQFRGTSAQTLCLRLEKDDLLKILDLRTLAELPEEFKVGLAARMLRDPELAPVLLDKFASKGGNVNLVLRELGLYALNSGYSPAELETTLQSLAPDAGPSAYFLYAANQVLMYDMEQSLRAIDEAADLRSPAFRAMLAASALGNIYNEDKTLARQIYQERKSWFAPFPDDPDLGSSILFILANESGSQKTGK